MWLSEKSIFQVRKKKKTSEIEKPWLVHVGGGAEKGGRESQTPR